VPNRSWRTVDDFAAVALPRLMTPSSVRALDEVRWQARGPFEPQPRQQPLMPMNLLAVRDGVGHEVPWLAGRAASAPSPRRGEDAIATGFVRRRRAVDLLGRPAALVPSLSPTSPTAGL